MKKTIGLVGIISCFVVMSAKAQTTDTLPQPTQPATTQTQNWDPKNNKTVDAITSKYKDKYVTARPASTIADVYPVVGTYESATNADAASVTVTLDPENKGIVWIEGLPQGKVKAMLRKSPATYKIPAQKTEDGKEVAEGVLIFDKEVNTLSIAIGKEYNMADPASAFLPADAPAIGEPVAEVKVKEKTKVKKVKDAKAKAWIYTGTKVETETAMHQ